MTVSRWDSNDVPDLSGRVVLVTGASGGLGRQTTRVLAGAGAHVVLAVRDLDKGQRVAAEISGDTDVRTLDPSDLVSVRAFAKSWEGPIDILINNAGIMAVPEGRTANTTRCGPTPIPSWPTSSSPSSCSIGSAGPAGG